MKAKGAWVTVVSFLALVVSSFIVACPGGSLQAAEPAPQTVTAEVRPFRVFVSLQGVFLPQEAYQVRLAVKQVTELKVLKAARHGARVKRGDLLLALDPSGVERALEDTRRALKELQGALQAAELELREAERDCAQELESAARKKKYAEEDLARFLRIDKPERKKAIEFSLKRAQWNLLYQEEELKQLERMYKEDELTEETEEIVLTRQRNSVESARYALQRAKISAEKELKIDLPREELGLREAAREAAEAYEHARKALPLSVEEKRRALEAKRTAQQRTAEKLEELLQDRKLMTVTAPGEGVVYYGSFHNGAWSGLGKAGGELAPGDAVTPGSAVMTVVTPGRLVVRAKVPEQELHLVKPGVRAICVPAGYPELRLSGIVRKVGAVPRAPGAFDCEVTLPRSPERIVPGMRCRVRVLGYEKKKAVVVPQKALFVEEGDPDQTYVYVRAKGGRFRKRRVRTGKRYGGKVEILSGLKGGEVLKVRGSQPEA